MKRYAYRPKNITAKPSKEGTFKPSYGWQLQNGVTIILEILFGALAACALGGFIGWVL